MRTASAAVSCLYEAYGCTSPLNNPTIQRLSTALVKSGTRLPARRSQPMPVQPFHDLSSARPSNEFLDLKRLRMKTLTLLALVFMARPSDFALKARVFNPATQDAHSKVQRGSGRVSQGWILYYIVFQGTKNDTGRGGFEMRIPRAADAKVDPVACLQAYMNRTAEQRRRDTRRAVFLTLRSPFKAITASTIAQVMQTAIQAAGLGDGSFSAKSFRPTGASAGVPSNCPPETAMQIGRWKTSGVFLSQRAPWHQSDVKYKSRFGGYVQGRHLNFCSIEYCLGGHCPNITNSVQQIISILVSVAQ